MHLLSIRSSSLSSFLHCIFLRCMFCAFHLFTYFYKSFCLLIVLCNIDLHCFRFLCLHIIFFSRKKVCCPKSWCKSDVDPARIRCCHQHRLSNKTYSAIPEQRTTRQLCFHCHTVPRIFVDFHINFSQSECEQWKQAWNSARGCNNPSCEIDLLYDIQN